MKGKLYDPKKSIEIFPRMTKCNSERNYKNNSISAFEYN